MKCLKNAMMSSKTLKPGDSWHETAIGTIVYDPNNKDPYTDSKLAKYYKDREDKDVRTKG